MGPKPAPILTAKLTAILSVGGNRQRTSADPEAWISILGGRLRTPVDTKNAVFKTVWSCERPGPLSGPVEGLHVVVHVVIRRKNPANLDAYRRRGRNFDAKTLKTDPSGRNVLEFGTVRPRVQIPGPRPVLVNACRSRQDLALENLVLRHPTRGAPSPSAQAPAAQAGSNLLGLDVGSPGGVDCAPPFLVEVVTRTSFAEAVSILGLWSTEAAASGREGGSWCFQPGGKGEDGMDSVDSEVARPLVSEITDAA